MSYHVIVQFDVVPGHEEAFVRASLQDARESLATEPGTLSFDVLRDETNGSRFCLCEVYSDESAFRQHCLSTPFAHFFEAISSFASEPNFLFKGYRL